MPDTHTYPVVTFSELILEKLPSITDLGQTDRDHVSLHWLHLLSLIVLYFPGYPV